MMMKLLVWLYILASVNAIQAAILTPEETLKELSHEFRREVVEVTENVYVAVGFGASNASMVVGESGLIIIDTTEGCPGPPILGVHRPDRKLLNRKPLLYPARLFSGLVSEY